MSISAYLARLSERQQWSLAALLVLAVGIVTHFAYYNSPVGSMIDEVIFARYFSSYYTGLYYFDSHPPLGKLMVAAATALQNFEPVPFETHWSTVLSAESYVAMRLLPKLFGSVLPLLMFILVGQLLRKVSIALLIGLFVAFDNTLLTQSRFMFWDVYMLCFGVGALIAYFHYRQTNGWLSLLSAGILAGLAGSIKWTGFTYAALLIGLELYRVLFEKYYFESMLKGASTILGLALVVYVSTFVVHFNLLPKSGPSDHYMSENFQKTLEGSKFEDANIPPAGFISAFINLNREMYNSNKRTGTEHPYGSTWLDWPLAQGAMGYYYKDGVKINLAPNKVVWWVGSISLLACVLALLIKLPSRIRDITLVTALVGYLINWLPYAGITRVMFIHSYFSALLFSMLGFAWVLHQFPRSVRWCWLLIVPAIGYFLAIAPITYGL